MPCWRLPAAAATATLWLAGLFALALLTANPVTVNRAQLLGSDAVVVATAEPAGGTVRLRVERALAGPPGLPDQIVPALADLDRFGSGGRYVVPLRRDAAGRFEVTPTPLHIARPDLPWDGPRLVYPATDEVLQAAEAILATRAARPYP